MHLFITDASGSVSDKSSSSSSSSSHSDSDAKLGAEDTSKPAKDKAENREVKTEAKTGIYKYIMFSNGRWYWLKRIFPLINSYERFKRCFS